MLNELIDKSINWEEIKGVSREACRYNIEKATLSKDGKKLYIELLLNFPLEGKNLQNLRSALCSALDTVESAEIRKIYADEKEKNGKSAGKKAEKSERKQYASNGPQLLGKKISDEESAVKIADISEEAEEVLIEGSVQKIESRELKSGRCLLSLVVYDESSSIPVKCFAAKDKAELLMQKLKAGEYIRLKGAAKQDLYEKSLAVTANSIRLAEKPAGREDNYDGLKRVELHVHTKMSAMDGLNDTEELVKKAAHWGQKAVAITDHGVVQSFPDAANTAKALKKEEGIDIKIIYGMEGYLYDDADSINPDGSIDYKKHGTYHIILLAKTQEGMKNLYKLVSFSHIDYFYKRPRLPRSVLEKYRDGLIIGSACEAGELYQAVLNGESEERLKEIAGFYDYLEIQPLINNRFLVREGRLRGNEELQEINRRIVALGEALGKPVCATTDSHYAEPGDAIYRNILFAGQGYKDAEQGEGLYLRTTQEMLDEFAYLGEETAYRVVVENTNKIADEVEELLPVPKEKCPPKIEGAEERLMETCMKRAHEMYGEELPEPVAKRLEKELGSIIENGYAVMYVSAQMIVEKSLSDGYLVGSRGSVGSSLAATMAGITEINPLPPHYLCGKCKHVDWADELYEKGEYDCGADMPDRQCPVCGEKMRKEGFTIPFETFLGFEGDKEPDIDLNLAGEYQANAHRYVGEIFGSENVFKAGTVGTVKDRTAYGFVRKYYEDKGYMPNKYELEREARHCEGVKRTTGQHPGGIIILPEGHEIYEFCPVQHPANKTDSDIITTHFDYHKIDKNLLKLDLLGHDTPSMLRQLQDMTGVDPMSIPLDDKKVMSIFTGTEALGIKAENYKFTHGSYAIPEFGTRFVRQMLDDTHPSRIADLVRISGFSHGTDVWLGNAQEYIKSGQAGMKEVISTRDDIMNYLILKNLPNKDAFTIMERVRKGKGLTDEQEELMRSCSVPDWYIESCRKIQYMFPRAHAAAYTLMSFRLAWYKLYYPSEFYAAFLSTKIADFKSTGLTEMKSDVELLDAESVGERIEEYEAKGNSLSTKEEGELTVLEIVYELLARGCGFGAVTLGRSRAVNFDVIEAGGVKKILLPYGALEGVGETAARAIEDEFAKEKFDNIDEMVERTGINRTALQALRDFKVLDGLAETAQISFF